MSSLEATIDLSYTSLGLSVIDMYGMDVQLSIHDCVLCAYIRDEA